MAPYSLLFTDGEPKVIIRHLSPITCRRPMFPLFHEMSVKANMERSSSPPVWYVRWFFKSSSNSHLISFINICLPLNAHYFRRCAPPIQVSIPVKVTVEAL